MGKKVNLDSPYIVITGISPKLKRRVQLLAGDECKNLADYCKNLIYKDVNNRMVDIEKMEKELGLS